MNYKKIDGPLLAALEEIQDPEAPCLLVFIIPAAPPGPEDQAALDVMGFGQEVGTKRIVTATLSATMVEELSEMEWVRALRLSQKLRLLPGEQERIGTRDWLERMPAQEGGGQEEAFEKGEEPEQGPFDALSPDANPANGGGNQAGASGNEEPPRDTTVENG